MQIQHLLRTLFPVHMGIRVPVSSHRRKDSVSCWGLFFGGCSFFLGLSHLHNQPAPKDSPSQRYLLWCPRREETHFQSPVELTHCKLKILSLEAHGPIHSKWIKVLNPDLFSWFVILSLSIRFHPHKPRELLAQSFPSALSLPLYGHPPPSHSLLPRLCSPQSHALGISPSLHLSSSLCCLNPCVFLECRDSLACVLGLQSPGPLTTFPHW